ncbi:unnamed protein product [Sphagnum jensenii]|uniref:DUF155 domain-containing protein n=1 Tax=Sphagnum jensenii TaxID=128206 RepID=A0ABP0VF74_9BRYO
MPEVPEIPEIIDPIVRRGTILIYRAFDIGEEINLIEVERILRQQSGTVRVAISRGKGNAVIIRNAPVRLSLGKARLKLQEKTIDAEVFATVWDYGVLSLVFQVPIVDGTPWNSLIPMGAILNGDVPGCEELNRFAQVKSAEIADLIRAAIQRPNQWEVFEDYVIYFLEEMTGVKNASELLERGAVPELILGEPKDPLSKKTREGIKETHFQYSSNDLVVIDWNSAIVVEPSGLRDIPDVVEFALTQLLEFRYYDDLIDKKLAELYDSIEKGKHTLLRTDFDEISHEANSRYIEFSEFLERIDNSLKVVGDFYLAIIFRASVRRFRINDWQQSISRKMNVLAQVSELLQGELNTRRAHMLEVIVIILIVFEIISPLIRGHA